MSEAAASGSRHGSLPYVLPFVVFVGILAIQDYLHPLGWVEYPLRVLILAAVLLVFSRHVLDLRMRAPVTSVLLGIGVFVIWVAPDLLIPGYRDHWLFQNAVTGRVNSSIPDAIRGHTAVMLFRVIRAVILVPIIEELFWRAWLMRWMISPHFESIPLGAVTATSMTLTAVLFASEHGPYWDVGLIAGLLYNWWMVRTRSLGDCILAHGITNACLSGYVLVSGRWEYWL